MLKINSIPGKKNNRRKTLSSESVIRYGHILILSLDSRKTKGKEEIT